MTDAQLVKQCQKGKEKAQKELFNRFRGLVMGICLRYAKNREDAEDAFQEAYIKIFKSLKGLKDPNSLKAWVARVAVSVAITQYHKTKPLHQHTELEDHLQVVHDHHEDILASISNEQLVGIINQLPDGYRVVFNLSVIDGYAHHEIAEMLDISENTSRTQLFKARATLKKKLEKIGINRYEQHG